VVSDTMGYALAGLGRLDEAIASYSAAAEGMRSLGRRRDTADCLIALAETQDRAGQGGAARVSWTEALEMLEALDDPEADDVRRTLAARNG